MDGILEKLRPDRDLQCYFERPSAIAALSRTSADGFTLSGCWRQQFDWAVIEWNRDNVFEHPAFRNLPDGDLSGLQLSYEETRTNCMPIDSDWYPTVDWPFLRIWATSAGVEQVYKVALMEHASPIEGSFGSAFAVFELQGAATANDYIELSWLDEHYTYRLYGADTLDTAVQALADAVNTFSQTMTATRSGARITLHYLPSAGANGNRIGVYANVAGARTENWQPAWQTMSGGMSADKWKVSLDFGSLTDISGARVPTSCVRKLRWTYAADMQSGAFGRSEFEAVISNWSVGGCNRVYYVAGPGSRRIEDDSSDVSYSGHWATAKGNFSGGSIHYTTSLGAKVSTKYTIPQDHELYIGTRRAESCCRVVAMVDGVTIPTEDLRLTSEDVLVRIRLGRFAGGVTHTVGVTHAGGAGEYFYLDFIEAAIPTTAVPDFSVDPLTTLASDWDTDHSLALAPERTAWFIESLGFKGRANHYVGALWFYELYRPGHQYATATVTFGGRPEFGTSTCISLGPTVFQHVSLIGDTAATVAKVFEMLINHGSTGAWARLEGSCLTIQARAMGSAGNGTTISIATNTDALTAMSR